MFWLGADDPEEIAVYRLVNGSVELEILKEDARFVAEEPMLDCLPSTDIGRRLFPKDGRAFVDALIDQGRRMSYYDYLVEPETAEDSA